MFLSKLLQGLTQWKDTGKCCKTYITFYDMFVKGLMRSKSLSSIQLFVTSLEKESTQCIDLRSVVGKWFANVAGVSSCIGNLAENKNVFKISIETFTPATYLWVHSMFTNTYKTIQDTILECIGDGLWYEDDVILDFYMCLSICLLSSAIWVGVGGWGLGDGGIPADSF